MAAFNISSPRGFPCPPSPNFKGKLLGRRLIGVNARPGSKAIYNGMEFTLRMH